MNSLLRNACLLICCFQVAVGQADEPTRDAKAAATPSISFARDIQPLLAERCLLCHGPDEAEAGLRLDQAEHATELLESGLVAIRAGDPEGSELLRRVTTDDPSARMPPEGEPLTAEQIGLLRAWISGGAAYERHWAFQPVRLSAFPEVSRPEWCVGGIDRFVLAKLDAVNVQPSPPKGREALIRRLYADLIGLPPEIDEVDAFLADNSPEAYERIVDRLLQSDHFGERWGRHWLDMARYADSDGYEKDNPRPNAWRYRDWVIDAINRDLPLDQFTIEQLAGDLLDDPTPLQRLATAFHRQTLTNTEGGVDQEEFRVEATFDRTETTAAVWMALTMNCARCHSHKYDAISHRDYYQLFAVFNNVGETDFEIPRSDPEWERFEVAKAAHAAELGELESRYLKRLEELRPRIESWERELANRIAAATEPLTEHAAVPLEATATSGATLSIGDDGSVVVSGEPADRDRYSLLLASPPGTLTGLRLTALPDDSLGRRGPGRADNGNFVLTQLSAQLEPESPSNATSAAGATTAATAAVVRAIEFVSAEADFSQAKFDPTNVLNPDPKTGWAISPQMGKPHTLSCFTAEPIVIPPGYRLRVVIDQQYGGHHTLGRFRLLTLTGDDPLRSLPADVAAALRVAPVERSAEQACQIADHVATQDTAAAKLAQQLTELKAKAPASPLIRAAVIQAADRGTRRLERGDFLQPAEEIVASAPEVLQQVHPLVARHAGQPPDRLDLARWLVDPNHPLTARVMVNQIWQRLFGQGLVPTLSDFGVRGEPPTHPELLDWLAWRLPRELGWSRKGLIKEIVMSASYRQASRHRPELIDIDPTNRWLARQNRVRFEAEIVRDWVLATSGLLDRKVGGPSVFPPLPPGIAELSYANNFKWTLSAGGDRYRRGMYTFFKRTAPHPTLITFDCPDSNTSQLSREISNTPLQSLALLNNVVFAEAAVALAARVLHETVGDDDPARLRFAYRLCLTRLPDEEEQNRCATLLASARSHYRHDSEAAKRLVAAGTTGAVREAAPLDVAEHAAWASTLRILINLDEFIVRE